jgi:hypothetical protein
MPKVPASTITEKKGKSQIKAAGATVAFHPVGEVGDGGVWSGARCIGHIYADERKTGYVFLALDPALTTIGEFPTQAKAIECVVARTVAKRRAA